MLSSTTPLSACGRAVDYLRSCYRTKMRFGDTEASERWVQWQFVPADAPQLDRRTVFGSIQWGDRQPTGGPGEVVGAPRIWVRGDPYPWPYGSPPCGTVPEWETGFGSSPLPELPVGPDGVPECCGGDLPPVPVPQCPNGLPAVMHGRLDNAQGGGGQPILFFDLLHVPGSSPARWEGQVNWVSIGGTEVDQLTWSPSGNQLQQLRLTSVGCLDFDLDFAALFGPQTCEEVEWWYAFFGVFGCAPPGFSELLYRIRATPWP